jgi:hypothetical protein
MFSFIPFMYSLIYLCVYLLVYGLFNDAVSSSDFCVEWRDYQRPWPNLRYYHVICFEELKKTTKTLVRVDGLRAEILTQDLPNTKQACQPLDHEFGHRHILALKSPSASLFSSLNFLA